MPNKIFKPLAIGLLCLIISMNHNSPILAIAGIVALAIAGKTALEIKKSKESDTLISITDRKEENLFEFNVAGVTFKNEDRTSRQVAIKNLYKQQFKVGDDSEEDEEEFIQVADIQLTQYEYNGEDAYSVLINGKCIGNLPTDCIPGYQAIESKISKKILSIGSFINDRDKKIWFAKLKFYYNAGTKD